jgi:hypothetical protein
VQTVTHDGRLNAVDAFVVVVVVAGIEVEEMYLRLKRKSWKRKVD